MKKFFQFAAILMILAAFIGCVGSKSTNNTPQPNYSVVGRWSGVQTAVGSNNYYATARAGYRADAFPMGITLTFSGQNYISLTDTMYTTLVGKVNSIAQSGNVLVVTIQGLNQGGTTYSTSTTTFTGTVNNGIVTGSLGDPNNVNDLYTRFRADNLNLNNTVNPLPLSFAVSSMSSTDNTGYYTADTYTFNGAPTNCQAFGFYLPFAGINGFGGSNQSAFNGGLIIGNQPIGYTSGVTSYLVAATPLFPPPATWTTYGNFAVSLPSATALVFQGTDNLGNTIVANYTKLGSTSFNGAFEFVPDPASDIYYFQAFLSTNGQGVLSGRITDLGGRIWKLVNVAATIYQVQEQQDDGSWLQVASANITSPSINNIQIVFSGVTSSSEFAQRWINGTYQTYRI